jgi:ABC-type transporter Mla maintaining outer membrane lipid asymmetry permease subunit MlaE
MNDVTRFFQSIGEMLELFVETVYWCKAAFRNRDKIIREMVEIGNYTLPFAALISVFVEAALQLRLVLSFA